MFKLSETSKIVTRIVLFNNKWQKITKLIVRLFLNRQNSIKSSEKRYLNHKLSFSKMEYELRMPKTTFNNVEIEYETIGDPNSKPLLLIAGLGSQMYAWSDEMCNNLANNGFFVIRFDNRDVGLSTKFGDAGMPDFTEINTAYARREKPKVPYTLEDMVNDAVRILDTLKIDKAHICGASMGGIIAQVFAYKHPSRVLSLAIIMSTTGNPKLPPGKPEILM